MTAVKPLTEQQKHGFAHEFRTLLDWIGGDGLIRMGMVFRMAQPDVHTDEQGIDRISEFLKVARHEQFTPDVGVPVINLLASVAEHLTPFGAPMPSWEAKQAMQSGKLQYVQL